MIFKQNEQIRRAKLEEIFLSLNKKMYISIILLFITLLVGIEFQAIFLDGKYSFIYIIFPLFILLSLVFLYFINRITTKLYSNILYILLILFFYVIKAHSKDTKMLVRLFYIFICFMVMFINIKSDHSIYQYITFICYKVVIIIVIFCFYDFESNLKKYFIIDLFMIIFTIGFTVVNMILRRILLDNIEKLNSKNVALMNKFTNIFNTMKSPLISINFKKMTISFNFAFINFIKLNYNQESDEIKYLFDEMSKRDINLNKEIYINDLSPENKLFFEKNENYLKPQLIRKN